jgi:outer membrane immunogenic protein
MIDFLHNYTVWGEKFLNRNIALAFIAMLLPSNNSWAADLLVDGHGAVIKPHIPPEGFQPPVPPNDGPPPWEGAYIGGNIDWLRAHFGHPFRQFINGKGGDTLFDDAGYAESRSGDIIGGIQIGYNWNLGANIIAGIEADFQLTDLEGTSRITVTEGLTTDVYIHDRMDWFGTVRGRLGYALSPSMLFYGTGGMAYTKVSTDLESVGFPYWPGLRPGTTYESSETLVGWAVGAGSEYAFHRNWTLRLEYLYADFGRSNVYDFQGEDMGLTIDKEVDLHTVRLGLNYRF